MVKPITALAAMLFAAALIVPTVSQAREFSSDDDRNSVTVSYADLNLVAKPAQDTLKRRIVHAARDVCVYEDTLELSRASLIKGCRTGAVASAQPAYEAAIAAARHGSVTVLDAATLIVTAP